MTLLALGLLHWLLTAAMLAATLWLAHMRVAGGSALLGGLAQVFFGLHLLLGLPLGTIAALRPAKALWSGPRLVLWALNSALWMLALALLT